MPRWMSFMPWTMALEGLETHDIIIWGMGFQGGDVLVKEGCLAQRLAVDGVIRPWRGQRSTFQGWTSPIGAQRHPRKAMTSPY